ncbi:hypothetical protein LSH36_29g00041 [Paralvinella palmiformis]|uniref:Uncharacterized protein n=1 Tax=Paralvinella palmiformis TaxID=53620 RepID=A0AAD9K9V0_9ANNE|nr:hypothetical protein LSH36_29g00041 [Paralvinella palmiformis]
MASTKFACLFLAGILGITGTMGQDSDKEESVLDILKRYMRDNPEYVAMTGMGIMIILLFITVISIICCYTGQGSREEDYKQ